jgi:hypothetical protein
MQIKDMTVAKVVFVEKYRSIGLLSVFQDSDGAQRRNTLEDLNKVDLIKKCKSLLIIAQRAKQAKDGKICVWVLIVVKELIILNIVKGKRAL